MGDVDSNPDEPTCSVCGVGGYWVGYDRVAREDRCVTHLAHNALCPEPKDSEHE